MSVASFALRRAVQLVAVQLVADSAGSSRGAHNERCTHSELARRQVHKNGEKAVRGEEVVQCHWERSIEALRSGR